MTASRASQLQMFGLPVPIEGASERPAAPPGPAKEAAPPRPAAPAATMADLEVEAHREQFRSDPRPDLAEDHGLWVKLLRAAEKSDPGLRGALDGFRAAGCRLVQNERGAYVIRPLIDPESGWSNQAEYEEAKRVWLMPYAGQIAKLLAAL